MLDVVVLTELCVGMIWYMMVPYGRTNTTPVGEWLQLMNTGFPMFRYALNFPIQSFPSVHYTFQAAFLEDWFGFYWARAKAEKQLSYVIADLGSHSVKVGMLTAAGPKVDSVCYLFCLFKEP